MYEQKSSYDPVIKEATIDVPAHNDRVGVRIIIGEQYTVTVSSEYCVVEDTPEDFDFERFESNESPSVDDVDAVSSGMI